MTIRPRAVRALRDVRARMRDAAAATHASAALERDAHLATLADKQRRLDEHVGEAETTLTAARSIHDIDRFAEDTGVHRLAIAEATTRSDEAHAVSEATGKKLRDSARQLRSAERLVELADELRNRAEARNEQRAHDDMAGRRVR